MENIKLNHYIMKIFALFFTSCLVLFIFLSSSSSCLCIEKHVGKEIFSILSHPSQVIFASNAEQKILSSAETQALKKWLLNDKGYFFDRKKKCLFIPQGTFLFKKGPNKTVNVVISLLSKQVKIETIEKVFFLDMDLMITEVKKFMEDVIL